MKETKREKADRILYQRGFEDGCIAGEKKKIEEIKMVLGIVECSCDHNNPDL